MIILSNVKKDAYFHLTGTAEIVKDDAMVEKLWTAFVKTWFDGKDDPNLTLIRVDPEHAHYWDTKNGKIVSDLKILFSAVTGASMDDAREGELEI